MRKIKVKALLEASGLSSAYEKVTVIHGGDCSERSPSGFSDITLFVITRDSRRGFLSLHYTVEFFRDSSI